MPAPAKRAFHYHASAHALSGQFTRPIQHLIEVQAATALPTIGGHGNARVDDFRFNHLVSFKAGYTHVSGSELREGDKLDRKSTRLNSSHSSISYAVFCLKKKKTIEAPQNIAVEKNHNSSNSYR